MTGPAQLDPVDLWRNVSERAAQATGVRSRDLIVPRGSLRPAATTSAGLLMLAAIVITVTLAIRPGVAPGATDAVATTSPSNAPSPSAVVSSTADDVFALTLTVPSGNYTAADAIQPLASVGYLGPNGTATFFHATTAVVFSIKEVGGNRVMEGGTDTSCESTEIGTGSDLSYPFVKSGSPTDDPAAGFDRAWYEDPVLRLPAGQWAIAAELDASMGDCATGERHRLRVSVEITVVPGNGANEPLASSKEDGTFSLSLRTSQGVYGPEEAIEPIATVAYLGPNAETTMFTGDPPVLFAIEELGGGRRMDWSQNLPCVRTTIDQAEPRTFPFVKSGPDTSFGQAWYEDPVLHLPVGTWRVRAVLRAETTDGTDLRRRSAHARRRCRDPSRRGRHASTGPDRTESDGRAIGGRTDRGAGEGLDGRRPLRPRTLHATELVHAERGDRALRAAAISRPRRGGQRGPLRSLSVLHDPRNRRRPADDRWRG